MQTVERREFLRAGLDPWRACGHRHAANPGELLSAEYLDPELYFDPDVAVPDPSAGCGEAETLSALAAASEEPSPWEAGLADGYWERAGVRTVPAG
jgi:hypothetical protein